MKRRMMSWMMALGGLAAAPTVAQIRPMGVPAPRPPAGQPRMSVPVSPAPATTKVGSPAKSGPDALAPTNPDFKADQPTAQPSAQAVPVPPPLPPAMWDVVNAGELLRYIAIVGKEGLNPTDYDPAGLQAAIQTGNIMAFSAAATDRFNKLSSDLALGHVKKPGRIDWWVADGDLNAVKQDALLRSALAAHAIPAALEGLLPTHPQYAALKVALADTPESDEAKRDRIRLNLDRWRWLPRDLGSKYIIVNVPGFHATLVENGVNRWKQRAIAGKLSTPTPQLNALATGVILNPWWEVPKSIEREAAGKKGFVPVKGPDGAIQRWRQPPGPTNALGQIKFVMPNSKAIYLHDTNARSRFNDATRALSHGCVRTEHILDLATELLGDDAGEWTPDRIEAALDSKKSVQASFVKPVPVYIVYFSAAALNDGRIVDYKDLYGRDAKAMAALLMKDGGASLPIPKDNDSGPLPKPKAKPKPANQVATR
ncbi:MAG: L,D-transpeptidase YcbB [Sphingomonadales bacterium]|jgi:murein L,D-transpeptidase YcbB/YkuD|nr:L,D-transpeptidase YcbB [Sphingomonadales bacterium]